MASKKKQSEGIAMLSVYDDDDEDDEEMEDREEQQQQRRQQRHQPHEDNRDVKNLEEDSRMNGGDYGETSTPQQPQVNAAVSDSGRRSIGRLTIVDYGHDEAVMSPGPKEGEIDLHHTLGDVQERTPLGSVQANEQLEQQEPDTMSYTMMESETLVALDSVEASQEEVHPLDKFIPLPPKVKCSEELQRKIDKFLGLKRIGKSFNAEVRNRKDYRNPDFLLHAVRYQDIDQIGSCFRKDVFDPHGYDKSDYYDVIEADMRHERERKDQENEKNQKVEFVAGVQTGIAAGAQKHNIPIPGVSVSLAGGLPSVPIATDAVARNGRQNKKSKWDKVDGDLSNPLPSAGLDSVSAIGARAAILSASNVGAGYTAFAKQRRQEAEEKRSRERKLERRFSRS